MQLDTPAHAITRHYRDRLAGRDLSKTQTTNTQMYPVALNGQFSI